MKELNIDCIESAIVELEHAMQNNVESKFGVFKSRHSETDEKNVYIVANEEGILEFSHQLLSSLISDNRDENNVFDIATDDFADRGDYIIRYVKVVCDNSKLSSETEPKTTWKDKFFIALFFCILLLMVICFFWGFCSIIGAIFN